MWNNWIGKGSLDKIIPRPEKSENLFMKQFFVNGSWNIEKLNHTLSSQLINHITRSFISKNTANDYLVQNTIENRLSFNKATWDHRNYKTKQEFIDNICHSIISFKYSFLTWRMIKKKLPFNPNTKNYHPNTPN